MRQTLATVAVGLFCSFAGAGQGADKKDEDSIQGSWTVTAWEKSGQKVPADTLKQMKVTFAAEGKVKATVGAIELEGTVKLDASRGPKELDFTLLDAGNEVVLKAIYTLDGDSLRVCIAHPQQELPTELTTRADQKAQLFVMRGEKK